MNAECEPRTMDIFLGTIRIEDNTIILNPNDEIKNNLSKKGDHSEYVSKILNTVARYLCSEQFVEKGQKFSVSMEIK